MSNTSTEPESCARAILTTYQQINDTPNGQGRPAVRSNLHKKNQELEHELHELKEKYKHLQTELHNREKKLVTLNQQLVDNSLHIARLQDDFENAIYQLTRTPTIKQ